MGHHRTLIWVPALLGCAWAADRDPAQILSEATAKVAARSASLPHYTCVENVERNFYGPTRATLPRACSILMAQRPDPTFDLSLRLSTTDRLRLDVALVDNGEIYSWAGASHFRDNDSIDKLVRAGPIGTGVFAGLLDVVMLHDVQRFYVRQRQASAGGGWIEYSFRVPTAASHYRVKIGDQWVPVAYSGTVTVDSRTNDVVRLTIDSGELPKAAGLCQIKESVEFGAAEIAGQPFLLPSEVRQGFLNPNGGAVENAIHLTNCREYSAESSIHFGPEESTETTGSAAPLQAVLPEGLHFTLELVSPIDIDRAAAGDNFQARLVHPIHAKKPNLSIPAGAIVEGRLLRVETIHRRPLRVQLALSPRTVQMNGETVLLRGTRDWKTTMDRARINQPVPAILLPLPGENPSGVFEFVGQHVVVPKGFRSEWWSALVETGK
ncbi:MAG TPA: hypothetical protein VKB88_27815 [Bryobacteraceae bacterium]|nr:hypothetical protein [Bryobacteraceae bacterium]